MSSPTDTRRIYKASPRKSDIAVDKSVLAYPDPRCAMLLQLADADLLILHRVIGRATRRLTQAHLAYAKGQLQPRHYQCAYKVRGDMAMLLAAFEDKHYGSVDPEMLQAMRHIETAAHAFVCRLEDTDDVRQVAVLG